MKELLIPFTNWRVHVLAVLGMVAAILLSGTNDDAGMLTFIIVKAAGFALACGIYRLAKYWDNKGKINELMALADEED